MTDMHRIADILPQLTIAHDDMSNSERLKELLAELNPRGIFHCAASNIKVGIAAPEDELVRVNVLGTIHLAQALADVDYQFFINCGTYFEYGLKQQPFHEDDRCEPLEPYALTKLASTLYCQSVAKNSGKPIVTFRIFNPYGPGMEPGRLVYEVVNRAVRGEEIMITKPDARRDLTYIDDLVDLFMEAKDQAGRLKGEIFNLANGETHSFKELTETALKITNSTSKVSWGGAKEIAYDKTTQEANMKKTFAAFTWRPRVRLEAGIAKMIERLGGYAIQ
jgi:nucleoside-diphosphate-sugar epimerase